MNGWVLNVLKTIETYITLLDEEEWDEINEFGAEAVEVVVCCC